MIRMQIAIPLLCAVTLITASGCASEQQARILTPYLEGDFQTWTRPGKTALSGQAFLKLPSGRVITCAGEAVTLVPANGYNLELEQVLETGKGIPANYERRAHKYDHKAVCDAQGRFSFENLPTLNWLLMTRIAWQEPPSMSWMPWSSPNDKGGYLFQEVQIGDDPKTVTLSNPDYVPDSND